MGYHEVWIDEDDITLMELWEESDSAEQELFLDWLRQSGWLEVGASEGLSADPVKRLEIISALRSEGFTVEPA